MEKRLPVRVVHEDPKLIWSVPVVVISELIIPGLFLHVLSA
jgi:hypothetical protein